tara:strand:+ start:1356 stop:1787 length:432 start_codon:yes stop_codon:yes gene_type:complete
MIEISKDRPSRPWKNFHEYRAAILKERNLYRDKTFADDQWPCSRCWSTGRINHPDYRPDPIEGHKLTPHVDCPSCGGTGISRYTTKDFRAIYRKKINDYKKRLALWQKMKKRYSYAKLTVAEDTMTAILIFKGNKTVAFKEET